MKKERVYITYKKRMDIMILILIAGLCIGCGKEGAESNELSTESRETNDIEWNDTLEMDFTCDYSEDIKADVDYVVSGSASLQKELENIEEITRNRAYVLANELAKIKGESFVMPEISAKYGLFVDNQGTGNVYSSLITRQGWEGEDEAIISIYRQGETEGTFVDNGNGELAFTSDDGSVKGIIKINKWDSASFIVTETSGESVFSVGEEVSFPFAF